MPRIKWYRRAVMNIGLTSTIRRTFQKNLRSSTYTLTSNTLNYPVYVRPGTSDLSVFDQIFVAREYHCLDSVEDAQFIIDCGANVGYSSAYFLSRYPKCSVVAIEPDPDNYAMLIKNLLPYRYRCRAFQAAVWPHIEKLRFEQPLHRGGEWARSVRPAQDSSDASIETMSMQMLIDKGHKRRVSILKIDIEGAELWLFDASTEWLDVVDNIVIELHNEQCSHVFFRAIADRGFDVSRCGELTICLSR